jgi:putative intracellular protease/amidase
MAPSVIFLMADYGNDPTETAIPWKVFTEAGFEVVFATEHGKAPACDSMMLTGWTGALLGAPKAAKKAYNQLVETATFQHPKSWTEESFTLKDYDGVVLPGGHDKGIRQIIDSERVHHLLAEYFPLTKKPSKKCVAAICHGVQVLAASDYTHGDIMGKSVLANVKTTALQGFHEQFIYHVTRLFLGDYYKTYGHGTPSVQEIVTKRLDRPEQFQGSLGFAPFVVEDDGSNYVSARYPPDAEEFGKKVVEILTRRP